MFFSLNDMIMMPDGASMYFSLQDMIVSPICHFLLSGIVGVAAYLLLMAFFRRYCFPRMSAREIFGVNLCILFFCLGLAFIAHVVEDYTFDWF